MWVRFWLEMNEMNEKRSFEIGENCTGSPMHVLE